MIKFALAVPCKNFIDNAFDIFEQHNKHDPEPSHETYVMEEIILTEENLGSIKIDADVIITRGLLAQILKSVQGDIPVTEISTPATDILRALNACHKTFQAQKVGIIAARNMLSGIDDLEGLTDIDIRPYELSVDWNGPALVDRAIKDGCQAVLGGLATCRYASMIHVNNKPLATGRDAFWQAVTAAKRMAHVRRVEQEKSGRMQVILDTSKEGFISLDLGKQILMINRRAEKILGLTVPVQGLKVEEAPFPIEFKRLLVDGSECRNEIFQYNDTMLIVDKRAIRVGGVIRSMVVACQEVGRIQALESNLRKKIYSVGHVAKASFSDVVCTAPAMAHIVKIAQKYSRTDSSILLTGQSGAGKEILAQSIHGASPRKEGPFVAVNCAAIPESLLESELFGYATGAFSGARREGKPGFFEMAHTGTIFLDEIGEIPLAMQAKLLRAIQEREIIRLGSDSVLPVNIRIIAATNRHLEELVQRKAFREDLFFRLDVLRINIPPLAERREDIPLLVEKFLNERFPDTHIEKDAVALLQEYEWPGNVRQLFNVCERLAVLKEGKGIRRQDVLSILFDDQLATDGTTLQPGKNSPKEREQEKICRVLAETQYHRGKAAAQLGIDRSTLWRKMKEYRL